MGMTAATNHPDDLRVVPEWELCDRLTRSLRMVGLSSIEVAQFMGVTPTTVSRWINGRTKPSRAVLMIWADMTGVDLEWLETGAVRHQGLEPRTRWYEGFRPDLRVLHGGANRQDSVKAALTPKLGSQRPGTRHLRRVS